MKDRSNGHWELVTSITLWQRLSKQQKSKSVSDRINVLLLFLMSFWESNLKIITVDEAPKLETLHTINWLKTRTELLLSKELDKEALSLIDEFDDPLEAVS